MKFTPRELSWLDFNNRVFAEAQREDNRPLDRLKFLAITASNLDEFFMVRVAYLHDSSKTMNVADETGAIPSEQLEQVLERTRLFQKQQNDCLQDILKELDAAGIRLVKMNNLKPEQLAYAKELFQEEVLPVVTPLAVDPARPFPFLINKTLNIGVRLKNKDDENVYALVQVPSILRRFIKLPGDDDEFLPLEELIEYHLPTLFNLHKVKAYGQFRITRSADFDADDDALDLMEEMKHTLKKRRRGRPIRLELSPGFDKELRVFIHKMLGVNKRYIIELPGMLDISALSRIASIKGHARLKAEPITSVIAPDFAGVEDIFAAIRERDRLVHHPYHSFEHVTQFIKTAADDPDVLAIKQTLYRVSGKSEIIAALERAAEIGKQVTVLVELKARFDEENNIQWANRLERAGCHVIYGISGLKTHCKVTLVVRKEDTGIRRYVHMSTGNYNDVTAKIYTDIGLFTCRPAVGEDASALFNRLTGFSEPIGYNRIITAPDGIHDFILYRIDEEIKNCAEGLPCGIDIKVNSLLDVSVVKKLVQAGLAGVPVRLLVRGICSLVPESENIRVRSIVGQLLEHPRIFVFENGGDKLVYLGSADMMPRNLYSRVEVIFPVGDERHRHWICDMLELQWQDCTNAWDLGADGVYRRAVSDGARVNSQYEMARRAAIESRDAQANS